VVSKMNLSCYVKSEGKREIFFLIFCLIICWLLREREREGKQFSKVSIMWHK
jgi:hypothetical protein